MRLEPSATPKKGASEERQQEHTDALEAAPQLLSMPWELLYDETSFLFQGVQGVRVRRALRSWRTFVPTKSTWTRPSVAPDRRPDQNVLN